MGYTTYFEGEFNVFPDNLPTGLSNYINKFSETRRMKRNLTDYGVDGEFYVFGSGYAGQDRENNVLDYNQPPSTQPGLWCKWIVNDEGSAIEWSGEEKFYDYIEWLKYITENFILPFGYHLVGAVQWQGEEVGDIGVIKINESSIKVIEYLGGAQFSGEKIIKLEKRITFREIVKRSNELDFRELLGDK